MKRKERATRQKTLYFRILFFVVCSVHSRAQENDFPILTGHYLGQEPPGRTPEIFAPGIVSSESIEFKIAFSPDGKYLFYSSNGDIYWVDAKIIVGLKPKELQ